MFILVLLVKNSFLRDWLLNCLKSREVVKKVYMIKLELILIVLLEIVLEEVKVLIVVLSFLVYNLVVSVLGRMKIFVKFFFLFGL